MPDDSLILKGSLVALRDWTPEDVAPYREWLRPGQEWQAWDGPYFPRSSDQETDQKCQALRERIAEADWPTPRTTLVIADAESNVLIGRVAWYLESKDSRIDRAPPQAVQAGPAAVAGVESVRTFRLAPDRCGPVRPGVLVGRARERGGAIVDGLPV